MRRLIVGGGLTASLLVVPAAPAVAETTVNADGSVVTITIPVDLVGAEGKTSPDGTMSLVDYWEKILNDTWGAAFDMIPYKNCYRFELKLKLTAQGRDFDSTEGRHRIIVSAPTGGLTFDGTGFDGTKETSRNRTTGDSTGSLENDRDGAVPVDAAPTVVAHEFGHLMGLGDDRRNGAPKNGRDGTMMVGGVPGVDVNVVQEIDKVLIDRLGSIIERYLEDQNKEPLPKCQTWNGTLRAEHSVGPGSCAFTWNGTFEFGVVKDQLIGSGTVTPDGRCPAYGGPLTIKGTADDDGFTLGSNSYIFLSGIRVEKTAPDRAKGMSEYHDPYNDVITTFEMECEKNCAEPVG